MFSGWFDRHARICTWDDRHIFNRVTAQFPWEIETLSQIVKEQSPKTIVEIGSQEGGTLEYWLRIAPQDCKIVAIDPAPAFSTSEPPFNDPRLTVYKTRSDNPDALAAVAALGGIDFLFIDGDHSYAGSRYDFEAYGPMVRKGGGLIALHDIITHRPDCQVEYLWQEIQSSGYPTRELLVSARCSPVGAGIGIVYV